MKTPENMNVAPDKSAAAKRIRILFERDEAVLSRFLMRATGNPEDKDDILQEVYLRLLKQEQKGQERHFTRAYLFMTATNIIRDRRRKERVRKKAGSVPYRDDKICPEPIDPYPSAEAQLVWRQGVSIVQDALVDLKPVYAKIFMLHWGEGLTMSEISKRTEIPVRSVERYASHALSHCKRALEKRGW